MTRERRWRHLDTCQYRTVLVAKVPRVDCPAHGPRQVGVPWADPGSRFTALFEALIIDWLKEASVAAVSRRLGASWDEVSGVRERAVKRGLARRKLKLPRLIGVDETAFQKRHEYVTVVSSLGGEVLHVADGRGRNTLIDFFAQFTVKQRERVEVVAMDMWKGYIYATRACIPDADRKIAFDKFHVAQHLSKAVDKVRQGEHRELMKEGDDSLRGTRFTWLKNPANIDADTWRDFKELRESTLRTARAWSYKELAMMLWHYRSRGMGTPILDEVVPQRHSLASRAGQEGRPHGARPPRGHRDGRREARHQRTCRGHQLHHSVAEIHRARLPQPRTLPHRDLLPPRGPQSLP